MATKSLRVLFFDEGRRIAHRIEAWIDGRFRTMLLSCEGGEEEAWPASPALQSIHFEMHGQDQVAFLVGMAGTSHWSASVRGSTEQDRLKFEIACRAAGAPKQLGSEYEIGNSFNLMDRTAWPLYIDAEPPLELFESARRLELRMPAAQTSGRQTVVWSYSVGLQPLSPP